jgi:hypothetical protein
MLRGAALDGPRHRPLALQSACPPRGVTPADAGFAINRPLR